MDGLGRGPSLAGRRRDFSTFDVERSNRNRMKTAEEILRLYHKGHRTAGETAWALLYALDADSVPQALPTLDYPVYDWLRRYAEKAVAGDPSEKWFLLHGGEVPGPEPHRPAAIGAWIAGHGIAREAEENDRRVRKLSGKWEAVAIREADPSTGERRFLAAEEVPPILLVLRADRSGLLTSSGENAEFFFRLILDRTASRLEFTFQTGPRRGETALYAYRRREGSLRLFALAPQAPTDATPTAAAWEPMTEYARIADAVP